MAQRHPIEYAKVLLGLTRGLKGKELEQAIDAFIHYLHEEKVMNKANYIISAFEILAKEEEGIASIDITVAQDASAALVKKIESAFGKKVESTVAVDESLIGGLVVKKGNTILDGSVRTQIQKLTQALV